MIKKIVSGLVVCLCLLVCNNAMATVTRQDVLNAQTAANTSKANANGARTNFYNGWDYFYYLPASVSIGTYGYTTQGDVDYYNVKMSQCRYEKGVADSAWTSGGQDYSQGSTYLTMGDGATGGQQQAFYTMAISAFNNAGKEYDHFTANADAYSSYNYGINDLGNADTSWVAHGN